MQFLGLASDLLLLAATLGMALWCRALARRPKVPAAPAGVPDKELAKLREEIAELRTALDDRPEAPPPDNAQEERLARSIEAADDRIGRMEMLLASLEDLEESAADTIMEAAADAPTAETLPSFRASRPIATERSRA